MQMNFPDQEVVCIGSVVHVYDIDPTRYADESYPSKAAPNLCLGINRLHVSNPFI